MKMVDMRQGDLLAICEKIILPQLTPEEKTWIKKEEHFPGLYWRFFEKGSRTKFTLSSLIQAALMAKTGKEIYVECNDKGLPATALRQIAKTMNLAEVTENTPGWLTQSLILKKIKPSL
jgi:hypothetical protein